MNINDIEFGDSWEKNEDNAFVKELLEKGLSLDDVVIVLTAISEFCNYCFEQKRPCYCIRDD